MDWNTHDATAHAFRQDKHDAAWEQTRSGFEAEVKDGEHDEELADWIDPGDAIAIARAVVTSDSWGEVVSELQKLAVNRGSAAHTIECFVDFKTEGRLS